MEYFSVEIPCRRQVYVFMLDVLRPNTVFKNGYSNNRGSLLPRGPVCKSYVTHTQNLTFFLRLSEELVLG